MEFRILGALEALAAGQPVELGGARQQRILAALLLRPNRVVTLSRLVEATWDGEPPATAEHQVRNRVAAIRSVLTRVGGLVDTRGDGYLIRVADGELDSQVFDDLVEQGRSAGEPALLRSALALWRGPALDGLGGDLLRREAAAPEEGRGGARGGLARGTVLR